MLRFGRLIAVGLLGLAAGGCAATTMNVSSHVQSGVELGQYRTYDWGPADALPTGDPRLDKNPFFKDHVLGAVEKQMAARGYERSTTSAKPDLLIHYHASINQRIDIYGADREYGYCYGDDCGVAFNYEMGTLVLDVVDNSTNRVIWRGWAQNSVEEVLNNEDRMAERINEAVTRMLKRLPPSS